MSPDGHSNGPARRGPMNERTIGAIAAMLGLCCGGPVVVSFVLGAVGTAGLLSWFFKSFYFAIPAVFIALGLAGVWLHRRLPQTDGRFDPGSRE